MPRYRLTIRRMMIATAVVGATLAYVKARARWESFEDIARYHDLREELYREANDGDEIAIQHSTWIERVINPEKPPLPYSDPNLGTSREARIQMANYYARMRKYWRSRW